MKTSMLVRRIGRAGRYYLTPLGAMSLARRMLSRGRLETALALSPLTDLLDRARHPGLRYFDLDVARINALFPPTRRREVARAISDALGETDRVFYFKNPSLYNWRYRHLPPGVPALDDLYPPNLAVLDFLDHHVAEPRSEVLLDFACGIGALLVYARGLGLTRIHGFDNWTYLARSTAERFLGRFGLEASVLVGAEHLDSIPVTILTCVGFPMAMMMEASGVWAKPSVRYVLVDRLGRLPTLPGFRRTGEYGRLLTIFERSR